MSKENNNTTLKSKYDFFDKLVEPVRTQAMENTEEVDLITPIHFDDESITSILRQSFSFAINLLTAPASLLKSYMAELRSLYYIILSLTYQYSSPTSDHRVFTAFIITIHKA